MENYIQKMSRDLNQTQINEYRFLEAEVRLWILQVAFREKARNSAIVSDRIF